MARLRGSLDAPGLVRSAGDWFIRGMMMRSPNIKTYQVRRIDARVGSRVDRPWVWIRMAGLVILEVVWFGAREWPKSSTNAAPAAVELTMRSIGRAAFWLPMLILVRLAQA